MKSKTKEILRWVYIAATVGVIVVFGFLDPNFAGMGEVLKTLKTEWLILAFCAMFMYWLTDTFILSGTLNILYDKKVPFIKNFRTTIIGQYYSALTPSSTGGQPMQVVYMKRDGIPVGVSTCVMLIKFISYQMAMFTYVIAGYIINGHYYYTQMNGIFWLSILGSGITAAAVIGLTLIMINKEFVKKMLHWVVKILSKLKIIKNPEKTNANLDGMVDDFITAFGYLKKNVVKFIGTYFIALVHLLSQFSVTVCLYFAFGLKGANVLDIILLQALLNVTVTLMPLPGATGASEFGFYGFFAMIFPSELIFFAMMMWRLITYYMNIFVGAGYTIFDQVAKSMKKKKAQAEPKQGEEKLETEE